ncbi:MAG: Stk1 family PASTA domain-containing Ser/Thr kinase [Clostridia bacterium]|nr:Stk1 family PASTA domain-containing Ser/Thr kinase [Clostridia bacterium]
MIGKVLDNRYELVEFIGKGGMALVYRAVDQRTGHSVAVKILRPEFSQDAEFLSRFEREAMTASKMSHHNIVNLLDVGQEEDMRYLVMEYVRGLTLKDVIRQKGALPPAVAAQIAIRILSALQHAHNNGIIHRDIKPQNILVHSDGHIKVADFGIARVAGANTISTDESVMGSVHYFSPEQAKGESVTAASDLYSVGVVLYEMLTGQPPFDGETPVAVALQHINDQARPISELNPAVPPAMERVVEKAMEKRPEKRYQSALEMAQDLQRAMQEPDGTWLGRLPDKPEREQEKKPAWNTTRQQPVVHDRKWWLVRIGAALLMALVVAGIALGTVLIYNRIINTKEVPYCEGATEEEAVQRIRQAGLTEEIVRVSDDITDAGKVISQSPKRGEYLPRDSKVTIMVSTGPALQPVPSVTGMNVETAKIELEKLGFTVVALTEEREISSAPWDTVVAQEPAAEEIKSSREPVYLTLSGGSVVLPDLRGKPLEEARAELIQKQLDLVEIQQMLVSDERVANQVAGQSYLDSAKKIYYAPGDTTIQHLQVTLLVYVTEDMVLSPEELQTSVPDSEENLQ